ncbi:general odorant-binding protein 19d-like isoform X1 [Maniola jurtina]|uniref:general odorant-binding protein 19d-like isoform X1 n=2 Tax=Maniola jurtina TaxID=191418 RepID=UPI001E688379|nr:general odorant-binding protein 19d-like isoform X1 [Maniola jurtina]
MFHFIILTGAFFMNLFLTDIFAMTPEQKTMIHNHFEELGMECMKDYEISESDISDLRAKRTPTGEKAPCFLACVMKKVGVLDDSGMLQKETALDLAKKIFNDSEELNIIHDYLHSCSHVNSEAVGDGEKGCERAMKAYKCMIENASQFGIDL